MNNIEDLYELSPMQQGMLFHSIYSPKSEMYFEQLFCTLKGDLNLPIFQQAWQEVVSRHPVLRTSFHWEEIEKPLQMVNKWVDWPWICHDWRNLTKAEQQERVEIFLKSDRKKTFDLSEVPLMRFTLIQLEEQTYQFIWSHHHILFDGWSMQIILKEVFALYEANYRGESLSFTPSRPYRDYIIWLQEQDLEQAKDFWQKTLQDFEYPTPFRVDKKSIRNQAEAEQNFEEQPFKLSKKLTEQLQVLARQHHLTLNNLVQGAYALLLSRYSGENDIVFGATVAGRPTALDKVDSMVGLFINTLPIRVKLSGNAELLPWLKDLQTKQIEQEQYAYYSLADIQSISNVPAKMPLFESILVFENYPIDTSTSETQKALEISNLHCFERTNYPLTIVINPQTALSGRIIYDTNRFTAGTIARLIGHFQTLFTEIATNPQQNISQFSLLTITEQEEIVKAESSATTEYEYKCVHILFEEQVEKSPDAIALVYEEQQLTYRELNNRANQLAHYLQTLGVKPEVKVGICVERSLEMVIGILGILKAGGAYLPLDPNFPSERLKFMMEDAQPTVLLTQSHLQDQLLINDRTVVKLDSDWEIITQQTPDNLLTEVTPENLAYIIYTSGTTGNPKGSEVPHRSFIGFMFGVDYIQLDAEIIWLQHSSISWDGLTLELWPPLLYGGRCVLYPEQIPTPENLSRIIQEQNVNTLFLTTVLFNYLIDTIPEGLLGIKQLVFGGESVSVPHVRRALELLPETQIIHAYGPSECTAFTCCYPIPKQLAENIDSIPIGSPIGDRTVYLLDENLHRVPIGVPGELYVGGASVARGYLNQPELTSDKFIANPFIEGDRLYKSGDLARRLPDGNMEFLGRIDTQVKIRGFRIELEEIETVLKQHKNIKQVVVIAREDEPGNKYLVAYLVVNNKQPTVTSLRKFLKTKLPDYMIPATFVFLSALPLTSSHKINRRALPAPDVAQRNIEVNFVAPRNSTEREIAKIWTEVLRLKQVGIHANFFELGGHSLLATQVISRLREAFSLDFSLHYLFENPTIAELSQKVIDRQVEQLGNDELNRILGEVNDLSDAEVKQQLSSTKTKKSRNTTNRSRTKRKNKTTNEQLVLKFDGNEDVNEQTSYNNNDIIYGANGSEETMPIRKKKTKTEQDNEQVTEVENLTDVNEENSTESLSTEETQQITTTVETSATAERVGQIITTVETSTTTEGIEQIATAVETSATAEGYEQIATAVETSATAEGVEQIATTVETSATAEGVEQIATTVETSATAEGVEQIITMGIESSAISGEVEQIITAIESSAISGEVEQIIVAPESSSTGETKQPTIAVTDREQPPQPPAIVGKKKRLVVCCDGTWHELTSLYPTNVLKLARLVKYTADDQTSQLVFYSSGSSREDANLPDLIDRLGDTAFRWGIDRIIQDAYRFLCMNYDAEAQDEIYLFGFSRGAYIVRCLAGMIYKCGLLRRSKIQEIRKAYELYRDSNFDHDSLEAQQFRQQNSKKVANQATHLADNIPIKMLGCWETVGKLGIPDILPWPSMDKIWNINYEFYDATLSPIVENAFHGVAIDEKRIIFPVTPLNKNEKNPNQVVEEVWFAGEHSCVGGGNEEYRGLSDYALQWMLQKAQKLGLEFYPTENESEDFQIKPDPTTYFDNSVAGVYLLRGEEPRSIDSSRIAIHQSVVKRLKACPDYRPENLNPFLEYLLSSD
jgi:amino acid adenylation domain-containing protein